MVTIFSFSIGGYPGPWNCIMLKGKKLHYTHSYEDETSFTYQTNIFEKFKKFLRLLNDVIEDGPSIY